jgi:hypothetical protein
MRLRVRKRVCVGCWTLVALVLPILVGGVASADLVGDTIQGCARPLASTCDDANFFVFPPPSPPIPRPSAVVVGGANTPEFERDTGSNFRRADFDETTFRLTWGVSAGVTGFGPDTYEFTDLDYGFDIGGLEVIGTSIGEGPSAVFSDDAIHVTVPNMILNAGETRFLEFRVLAAVPVPSYSTPSLSLLGAALLGTGLLVVLRRSMARV